MKKILLVGKLNKNTKDLYERLSRRFQVQVSAELYEIVQGMVVVTRPDMILVNLMEYEDIQENVFALLDSTYMDIPVLVFGPEASCSKYKSYFAKEQFVELNRPVNQEILVNKC